MTFVTFFDSFHQNFFTLFEAKTIVLYTGKKKDMYNIIIIRILVNDTSPVIELTGASEDVEHT